MQQGIRIFNRFSLAKKLSIIMILFVTVALALIISLVYVRTVKTTTDELVRSNQIILKLQSDLMGDYMEKAMGFTLSLRNDSRFIQIVSTNDQLSYSDIDYLKTLFSYHFYSRKDVNSLDLYLQKSKLLFSLSKSPPNIKITTVESENQLQGFSGETLGKNYLQLEPLADKNSFIQMFRSIINIQDQASLAIVSAAFDNSFIKETLVNQADARYMTLLLDKTNRLFFSSSPNLTNEEFVRELKTKMNLDANPRVELQKEKYFLINEKFSDDWKLVLLIPTTEIHRLIAEPMKAIVTIGIIFLILACLIINWITHLLMNPLKELATQMSVVGGGDFKTEIHIEGSSEFITLSQQFNQMTQQINSLIEKSYQSEISEKQARLQALEYQLNPHFLYNTLQTISTAAILNNQREISRMIEALAFIMRYPLQGDNLVMVSKEISYVESYLLLQKARFEERLAVEIDVSETVQNLLLPKMSVQLLVENAINHGMENTGESIKIKIHVYAEEDSYFVRVSDNGKGMKESRLAEVRKYIFDGNFNTKSVGLRNLVDRLRLIYGESFTFDLVSTKNVGTTATLEIRGD